MVAMTWMQHVMILYNSNGFQTTLHTAYKSVTSEIMYTCSDLDVLNSKPQAQLKSNEIGIQLS